MTALWTADAIAAQTGGREQGDFVASGVAFDSREVGPGDLFVALKGETTDGHRFVSQAFAQGAAGAVVSEPVDGPHVLVDDTDAALNALARGARQRMRGKVIGVTGSVGKTSVKEALFAALERAAPGHAHRSVKSYNNHVGVPLSLARMPAASRYAVLEMGMNHAGELAQLTRLVMPHVALITAIAPAHAEFFADETAIADAKAEIFQGLEPGGTAILPYDSPHRERLIGIARRYTDSILTFGTSREADVRASDTMRLEGGSTLISARLPDTMLTFTLGMPGAHWLANALAVIAAVFAAGGDLAAAGLALAEMRGLPGRGERHTITLAEGEARLIDESYNANPASMAATLAMLGRERGRRIAVLGEMRELGAGSARFHAGLADPIREAGVELALLVGPAMAPLAEALEGVTEFVHVADARAAEDRLRAILAPGDVILVKGSNAVGLGRMVEALAGSRKSCSI
ncbi:UDP-N-acetylmuramoyl-tripeptide--D-alanyl-D-alanine ligase [Sphingomonas quercus]|uniref:UDP-N-acetylmuramoyl-tripeptide--D-alanyl-D-alanine ligase n=1 Tax=Sphingomonas quercus TaxID=2842451 RepID=A0ABS6BHJ2_9SPHN|nr:UDP-N-acetylmuramoyl-tripeptide--D-alanyl-D-alanine ligase [Sphingomonas quercus]MBU3077774.1 UDP-N-acetylmuramoyl-tripeptide--D-alanyl-D-alanine ligase [Sphingomonas quercus]